MTVHTASAARANLHRLIDEASESHLGVGIAGQNAPPVRLSDEDCAAIRQTMDLLCPCRAWANPSARPWPGPCKVCAGAEMVKPQLACSRQALKEGKRVEAAGLNARIGESLTFLERDPFLEPPGFEKVLRNLAGAYPRRIDIRHLLVSEVCAKERTVRILLTWTRHE